MSSTILTPLPATDASAPARPLDTLKRGGAMAITGQGVKLVVQLGSLAVLARLLSPQDFGLFSLIAPIAAFFMMFRDLGLTSATIYTDDITDAEVTSLFWISTAAGIVIAALLLVLAPFAARLYDDERLIPVLAVMATLFVFSGIAAQYLALMQRQFRFRALVAIETGSFALATLVGIAAALRGLGYWSLVLIPVATQLFTLIAAAFASAWQPGVPRWESRTTTMARFGSSIAGFNVLNYFARNLDNLLIGKFVGLTALGFYGRAYALLMAPLSQVIYPLNKVVVPVLTRLNRDHDTYRQTFTRILSVILVLCVPLVTWLIVARDAVIQIFLGSQWQAVGPIFLALAFAALVQPVNNATGWLLLSQGRSRDILLSGVLTCVVSVSSFIAGLPWGATGVATAYAIGQIAITTPLLWALVCRQGPVRAALLLRIALPVWCAAAVAGFSFQAMAHWLALSGTQAPLTMLLLSFIWVAAVCAATLLLHTRGRELLATATPTSITRWIRHARTHGGTRT